MSTVGLLDGGRGGGAWCPLADLDAVGEELLYGGVDLIAVAGDVVAVLPDATPDDPAAHTAAWRILLDSLTAAP
ncbi:hypothetical protein ACFVZ3_13225 [Kitasatospora purpeofusca]|uniref:hypothetical protein n=1 Tax=Kitasatospora purpeofusca TaxID=67352 RepID=UPI0036AEA5F5